MGGRADKVGCAPRHAPARFQLTSRAHQPSFAIGRDKRDGGGAGQTKWNLS